MPAPLVHLINFGTLGLCVALFVCALLWVIRPGGVPLLTQIMPREHALRRARKLLATGDWQAAFAAGGKLRNPNRPNPHFDHRIQNFEGDCLYRAAELSLQGRRYSEALELMRGAGDRLGLPETEFDKRIAELLLAELRRRIASDPNADEIRRLSQEIGRVAPGHPEAAFWLSFHHMHAGRGDAAVDAMMEAVTATDVPDPALYLGVLLLLRDEPKPALAYLRRAAELAPNSSIVAAQLGTTLVSLNEDPAGAIRVLESATGPNGLTRFLSSPQTHWLELGAHSWLAGLARRAAVACPLGLDRTGEVLALARRSLAAAFNMCDRSTDAATIYYQSFSAGDQSPEVRKGLGLSLSRSGLYDDAMPHLQAAFEQENPPSPALMGHYAVCLTRVRPKGTGDHVRLTHQALNVLTAVDSKGNAEWARLAREVIQEAKNADVDLTPAHRLTLARAFAAIDAHDPVAVETYDRLAADAEAVPMDIAMAYVHAAAEHSAKAANDEKLFDRAFHERELLKRLFGERKWNFAKAERLYLEKWAQRHPGRYPETPGPLYAAITERALIDEARALAAGHRTEESRAALDLAFRLGPTRSLTLDLLAEQADQRGDRADVTQYLDTWIKHHPADARPLIRRALINRRDGRSADALEQLTDACAIAGGPHRAKLLGMTARIALAAKEYDVAQELFEQFRQLAPQAAEPLTGLAAIAWCRRDFERLASLAPLFNRGGPPNPVRSLLAAASFALAGEDDRAAEEITIAKSDDLLKPEAKYLHAVILTWQEKLDEARAVLDTIKVDSDQLQEMVQALRGQLAWKDGNIADAMSLWNELSPERRAAWGLNRHCGAGAFQLGMEDLSANRPAEALEWFRLARSNEFQHEKLAMAEAAARQRSGQPLSPDIEHVRQLETASFAQEPTTDTSLWLARAYRRGGDLSSANRILTEMKADGWNVALQRGLLALQEGRLADAESALSTANDQSPSTLAIEYNLAFTKLARGKHEEASVDFERAAETHPNPEAQRVLNLLAALTAKTVRRDVLAAMTPVDDQRIIKRIQQIGRIETVLSLLQSLAQSRSQSGVVQQALTDAYTLWARNVIDRGEPESALAAASKWPAAPARPLGNLLGVAAGMVGDFVKSLAYFQSSLPTSGDDARIQQNLALATSRLGDQGRAKHHWKRFLVGQPAHCPAPAGDANYLFRVGELVRQRLDDFPEEAAR